MAQRSKLRNRSGLRWRSAVGSQHPANGERGVALLIVVSMLTVIGIIGVAFAFSMYLETQASRQFVSTTQARYIAEGGVVYARALLEEDRVGSRIDDLTEVWAEVPQGDDADLDGDGEADGAWFPAVPGASPLGGSAGRYALRIVDEAGKVNLNSGVAVPSAFGPGEVNLTMLFQQAGLSRAREIAQSLQQYRYGGPQGKPGEDGVDDDRDGTIDEADEYQPLSLHGNDRRLQGLEDLAAIAGLSPEEIRNVSRVATVYSWDANVSISGKPRVNVNSSTAAELLAVLLDAGVDDPWQAAVNLADYADADVDLSHVTKSSQLLTIGKQGMSGGWTWSDVPRDHYKSTTPDEAGLTWSVVVPTGKYRVLVRGLRGIKVGDVAIQDKLWPSVDNGESLGVLELDGTLTVKVVNREPTGTSCAFRGIELVPETAEGGVIIRGIEAVRFNELMIEPTVELPVSSAAFDAQGSGWSCPPGSSVCSNSQAGQARWVWTASQVLPGHYYLRVFGTAPGQTVGEVQVGGSSQLLVHGQRHPSTVVVGSDGKVSVTIGKTASDVTYYVTRVTLSLQPDGEYVELINLGDQDLDVSGWSIEGDVTGGRQALLPSGSVIKAHGLLVAAVDLDDRQEGLAGNHISAREAWEMSRDVNAVQLEFPGGAPSPDDDWLKAIAASGGGSRLVLRSDQAIVDEVEYPMPAPGRFQSLEKGDPSVIVDTDQDGLDEGWYASLQLYTPGLPNENEGLHELADLETVSHDPSREVVVLNRPLKSIGELVGVPSGSAWKPFASADLAKIADRFTVEGLRLEAEGHLLPGQAAWRERADGTYEYSGTGSSGASGVWEWTGLANGSYRLSIYSCAGCSGERMAVRWTQQDGTFSAWSAPLTTDAQGRLVIGQIIIGTPPPGSDQESPQGTPAEMLTLEISCASISGICHVDNVQLDPRLVNMGLINVNTAPLAVLLSLPGMTETLASRIIAGRPYGDQDGKGRGIGDLLMGNVLGAEERDQLAAFQRMAHLLTTRSSVFQILSLGQTLTDDRIEATQRITAIVQR